MYYVSRRGYPNFCFVVDTEDGVESLVSYTDLAYATERMGLDVKGAILSYSAFGGSDIRHVSDVQPYQPEETKSKLQIKTSLLYDTDILVYGNEITSITVREPKSIAKIRLSDFGECVGSYVLDTCRFSDKNKIVLVLDNKLTFSRQAFQTSGGFAPYDFGVALDIHELNDIAARLIYSMFILNGKDGISLSIIDNKKRIEKAFSYEGLQ